MKKINHYLQAATFSSFLLFATGDTWGNLFGALISLTLFLVVTHKTKTHGM